MKSETNFWRSLEKYTWEVAKRTPLPWSVLGVVFICFVLLFSLLNGKNSVVTARSIEDIIEKAGRSGDYETASQLFENRTLDNYSRVLGVATELEDIVYPENILYRSLTELTQKLDEYPNHFEMLLEISRLYTLLENKEQADEYREKARILDPNNEIFR